MGQYRLVPINSLELKNREMKESEWLSWSHAVKGLKAKVKDRVVVQSLSCVQLFTTPWTAALQASLSFTVSQSLLKLASVESVVPSSRLILCRPLLLLPSIFPSIRVFSNESALLIRWPKYWCFSFGLLIIQEEMRNCWRLLSKKSDKIILHFKLSNLLILWRTDWIGERRNLASADRWL